MEMEVNIFTITINERNTKRIQVHLANFKKHNIVTQDIRIIENSDLFKYSPYKTLTEEQYKITYQIIERLKTDLSNGIPRISIIDGGAGTGKSILGIFY